MSGAGHMKIALTVEALSPHLTGIGRYTWELATRLAEDPLVGDLRYFANNGWIANPSAMLLPRKRLTARVPTCWRKRMVARDMADRLFHGPNYFLPPFVEGGVITVHDLSVFHFPETHPTERLRHFERDFASSLSRAAHIITDSQTVRHELMAFADVQADRITAIPLGVSPSFRQRALPDLNGVLEPYELTAGAYILCVSTIEPRKKIAELLHAWRHVPQAIRQRIPLVIIGGGGWLSEDIKAELERDMKEGWVRYLGYVPEADLPGLYAGAALFVYPSSYEGFGLPPIEAMASGVPVIVSNRSCLPEVTQGAAMVIDPDSIADFATALEQGLTDTPWRGQAISAGLKVAKNYTWERCATQTREIYQYVLGSR
jgi:alpha-1,3-rhamnosyl/mannosyltransferase